MITRATPFVDASGRLTPAAWLDLQKLARPAGPYADDAAALAAGLKPGTTYYTPSGELRVVL